MKVTSICLIFGLTVILATAQVAPADSGRGHKAKSLEKILKKYDSNGDGQISKEEYAASATDRFEKLDTDQDGQLTAADFPEPTNGRALHGSKRGRHQGPPARGFWIRTTDSDQSGDISAAEWSAFLAALQTDEEGVVDIASFVALLHNREDGEAGEHAARPPHPPRRGVEMLARTLDIDGNERVEVADFQQFFETLDKDGDGALSAEELPARGRAPRVENRRFPGIALARTADGDRNHEVSAEEWASFLTGLNADANGVITEANLRASIAGAAAGNRPERENTHSLSRAFDRDGDGVLNVADFNLLFSELDRNGDGSLQAEEIQPKPSRAPRRTR